jgi:WD40 repeat protein/energy-coupling factor transporter ATP-binding protein EcfA2
MDREALVVGINRYPLLRHQQTRKPQHLEKPAADAEAIAQLLEKYGNFRVQRLPEVYSLEGTRGVDPNPTPQNLVTVPILEAAIAQLFNPSGKSIPDTALLFFAGHGLRKAQADVTEGFLATSDVNPDKGKWGVSLRWLRELLQKSPVRQQIIWLDCCHSGELLNILDEANPGKDSKALDRCLIAACREFEVSREQLRGEHGILTAALLQGLEPDRDVDGFVTNYKLADFINKEMSAESQRPIFQNSGNAIILTDKMLGRQRQVDANLVGKCPYKALEYFTQEDAVFFYGRTALTDELIDKVRTQNFIAVLGASGSGKSSVLRAGLLDQLKRGQKLSGSDRWTYYDPFTPGEHPLASLENAIGIEAQEFSQFIATVETERVVLVIDQFEECFTMCQDSQEREEFFNCLLETLEQAQHKLCLVLGMRADFLGKCAEYAELAQKIDQHLVMVKPMTRQEIEEAITKPAELVDLQVEKALVTKMTEDVVESPGSLPLLQYTLTELWKDAQTGANRNRLTLESYNQLGGIEKTLPKRANQVYASLQDEEKPVAKRIFLELTQLGETSDTRRRVYKEDLVNSQHSEELLDRTLEQLVQAKLIVTTHESQSQNAKPGVILDIVHEALIRHWQELRQWVTQNQVALEIERKIEARAKDWERNGKTEDLGLLLQGATLIEAETYLKDYGNLGLLDGIAQEYIEVSQIVRDRILREEKERQQRELEAAKKLVEESEARRKAEAEARQQAEQRAAQETKARKAAQTRNALLVVSVVVVSVAAIGAFALWQEAEKQRREAQKQATMARLGERSAQARLMKPVDGLVTAIKLSGESQDRFKRVLDSVQISLTELLKIPVESNILQGHKQNVTSVAFSPDGHYIASGSEDRTVWLWDLEGNSVGKPFRGHQDYVNSIAFSPDGRYIITGSSDKTVRLWDLKGNRINTFQGHQHVVSSVAFSPDGKYIASGGYDGMRLWDRKGKLIQPFLGHKERVFSVAFSPDGQTIVSANGKTIQLWDLKGNSIGKPIKVHEYAVNSVAFSPDGKYIVTSGTDGTVRLVSVENKKIDKTFEANIRFVQSVTFSPDSQYIAIGSGNTVQVMDIKGNFIGQPFVGNEDKVTSVAFSPDGRYIATGSWDKTVRLWDLKNFKDQLSSPEDDKASSDSKALLKVACERLLFHPALVNAKREAGAGAAETCQKAAWSKQEASQFLVNQGRAMARQGNVGGAVDRFKQAQMLNRDLKIDPAEAQQLAALASSENEEQKQNTKSEVILPKLPNHATYGQVKLSQFTLNNKGNVVSVTPREKISAFTNYIYDYPDGQPRAINQIIVGIAGQNSAQACIYNALGIKGSGSSKFTLIAPNEPGIYYIRFKSAGAYGCDQGAIKWWRVDGEPTSEANIGAIVVVGQGGQANR